MCNRLHRGRTDFRPVTAGGQRFKRRYMNKIIKSRVYNIEGRYFRLVEIDDYLSKKGESCELCCFGGSRKSNFIASNDCEMLVKDNGYASQLELDPGDMLCGYCFKLQHTYGEELGIHEGVSKNRVRVWEELDPLYEDFRKVKEGDV
jgi:hypothetical protein